MSFSAKIRKNAAFTLIEVMLVVAVISILGGLAYFTLNNVRESSRNTKLMRDVATVNNALRLYKASGGRVNGLTAPQAVLDKLKTKLTGDAAKQMAGLRGGMLDRRMAFASQTSAEAAAGEQRAFWDSTREEFVIANSGSPGIREFIVDESLASKDYGTDDRHSSFKLAKENAWVWDFKGRSPGANPGPGTLPTTADGVEPGTPGSTPAPLKLQTPQYSISTGKFDFLKFPMDLTLTNPNPPGSSAIQYSVNGGEWKIFHDPIDVDPNDKVEAMVIPQDPELWTISDKGSEKYSATPVAPEFELVFEKSAYSYAELGGAMIPGTSPAPVQSVSGTLSLKNSDSIPSKYQSSEFFNAKWSTDGTNPLTSSTATTGSDFKEGFKGQSIPVTIADYGKATSLTVKAGASALNVSIFNNSAVVEKTLGITKATLRPPLISVSDKTITLALDTQYADIPVGARIFYTLDGSDPGNNNGLPIGGKEYTGPFDLAGTSGGVTKITARVYPPVALVDWFNPSATATKDVTNPGAIDFFVGGNFAKLDATGRNIAKLTGSGLVDSAFDVGKGATQNSLVGVIRQDTAGKVLAGGDFSDINSVQRAAVVRLNPNGSVDSGFDAGLAGGK